MMETSAHPVSIRQQLLEIERRAGANRLPMISRRLLETHLRLKLARQRSEQAGKSRHPANRFPELAESEAGLLAPASHQPVRHDHGVHGAGARARDAYDFERFILKYPVEYRPM